MEKLIQVLWVENDPDVLASYPGEAEQLGLELVAFECWDDAEKALRHDYPRWDAIVLDAKCKLHSDSIDKADKFLVNATNAITRLANGQGRFIPWYVLSGEAETDITDSIPEERTKWDGDWPKAFYDKNTDREMLYRRLRAHVQQKSLRHQIRMELYPEVFKAIEECGLSDDVETLMEELLLPVNFASKYAQEANNGFSKVRQTIEYVFRSMMKHGILPKEEDLKGNGGGINNTCCSFLLDGKSWKDKGGKFEIISNQKIAPTIICDNIRNMIETVGAAVHSSTNGKNKDKDTQTRPISDGFRKNNVNYWAFREIRSIIPHL